MATLCPWCGAYSPSQCELEEETGVCPWEESGAYEEEIDADRLREDRDERNQMEEDD